LRLSFARRTVLLELAGSALTCSGIVFPQQLLLLPALAEERIGRRALAKQFFEVALKHLGLFVFLGPFARLESAARRVGERFLVTQAQVRLPRLAALPQLLSELPDRSRGMSSLLCHFSDRLTLLLRTSMLGTLECAAEGIHITGLAGFQAEVWRRERCRGGLTRAYTELGVLTRRSVGGSRGKRGLLSALRATANAQLGCQVVGFRYTLRDPGDDYAWRIVPHAPPA
jgi:hypothetical protein